MIQYLGKLLQAMRPAFSRRATFAWFVVAFVGFVMRTDNFGVSSIVRGLWLAPVGYPCLLHFFHSTAWRPQTLLTCWWQWLAQHKAAHLVNGRLVLLGDHTKTPKDGRRMPEVSTLHQDSETAGKPSFFRGHLWGSIAMLVKAGQKFFATPLWAEIHRDSLQEPPTTRIVTVAAQVAKAMGLTTILVLDAYFATGTVFIAAAAVLPGSLYILTRAKKNVVAYLQAPQPQKKPQGRARKYGKKLKLMRLFDTRSGEFKTAPAKVYDKWEQVRYLTLNLLWKPTKGLLRFILVETSRGRMILVTSDLSLGAIEALKLYCCRVGIETMFDVLKNILGGMCYHFWSKYLARASRRPSKKSTAKPASSRPEKTRNTLEAIEKFVVVQLVVLGALQLIARQFAAKVYAKAQCWLRTPGGEVPSEFVTRTALSNVIRRNLFKLAKDWITQLILGKQETREDINSSQAA